MNKTLKSYRFDEHTLELIGSLKRDLNVGTNSDVLRKAITLLKFAVDNQKKGGAIYLKLGDSEKEILI